MYKRSMFLACFAVVTCTVGITVAEVDLKVDLAMPIYNSTTLWPETAKPGWTIWGADTGWGDMMQHDFRLTENLGGTGIDVSITVVAEGRGCLKAKGLCMGGWNGDMPAIGTPEGDPIANSWYYAQKDALRPKSNVILTFYELPGGEYELTSYHNYWEPCSTATRKCTDCEPNYLPPMPLIRAMSFADGWDFMDWLTENDPHSANQFPDAFNKIRGPAGPDYATNVVAMQDAYNVQPSWVLDDDEVATSLLKFYTDGSPVMIMYEAPEYESMSSFLGGRGVLNAFELKQMSATPTAGLPIPFDTVADVPRDKQLSWLAGSHAVEHDVYFGTSRAAVANASDPNTLPGRGRQSDTTYDPGTLALGTTYYWRIDEINNAEPNSPWKGTVWSFTTAECESIDGFEAYSDSAALQAVWTNGGNAWIECSTSQQLTGEKSLELAYYNRSGVKYSDAGIEFSQPQNLVARGISKVGLYFRGMLSNDTDRMYVTLEDTASGSSTVFYGGDPNALKNEQWQRWTVDLTEFALVDPAAVKSLTIGVGDKDANRASGASGAVYIDDIGFCGGGEAPVECACPGDLTGDDQIDLDDLQAVAGILLEAGSPFIVPLEQGHCGDLNGDIQADLDDLQAIAAILLDAGSPFIVPCE